MSKTFDEKNSLLKITAKFEGEEWTKYIEKARIELRKNIEIKGFRKGHAPIAEADKRIFKGDILDKALKMSIEKIYDSLVKPQINEKDDVYDFNPNSINVLKLEDAFTEIEFEFITLPVVRTKVDYKKLTTKLEKLEPTAADLKAAKNQLVEKYVVEEEVEDAIKKGDNVNFNFVGSIDNVEFDGGRAENFDLKIGSNQFIAGFEDQMVGLKKGEEKAIKVTFPKEYHAQHLAGKDAIFKVKINFIKRASYPEINEKFLQEINFEGIKTLKDFDEYAHIQALKERINYVQSNFMAKVIAEINKNATINIHKKLVDDENQNLYKNFADKLKEQQISDTDYFELTGLTKEKLLDSFKEESIKKIRESAIFGYILKNENLYPTQKEYEKKIAEIAKGINLKEEEIKRFYSFNAFANMQANQNVTDFVIKQNDPEGYKLLESAKSKVEKYDEARAKARKEAADKELMASKKQDTKENKNSK